MDRLATWVSRLFGWALLFLSAFVALETLLRKLFNTSLQGADELGGYMLALGASLSFIVAMIDRAHIRIDVLHTRFPVRVQALVDWLSVIVLGALGAFFLYVGWFVISDTMAYGSTAATPWRTPLIWPQAAWYAGLAGFALCSFAMVARASRLFLSGQHRALAAEFNPKSAEDELSEELDQLRDR
ncbi:permease [Salipiger aestuarii]|uniref:TRAP transporter small permease protein n=1 Tax=Salipiger aestuarii TaxID=568098 RepID=A0A327XYI3_9RHOB|nr:TRAP transporter small permease [Salipiger aestuarii]EIE52952.1 Tripartite ATP-independent periplasmic transporter DctQ component [Citreicella sp. 357]KAA8606319.1 permease [Salipiger aestuarii]KAA8610238.1 permease [Salipiger aestuarii]KAB2540954.1 permease [Salipiger aestuarii]RAK13157.1 TRAP-type mannitol/chloroaromatic compound transport system permease small subunit [Salipiger aestuarii]